MAIQVYKKGSSYEVRGIKCDILNVDSAEEVSVLLDKEWVLSEQDLISEPEIGELNFDDSEI